MAPAQAAQWLADQGARIASRRGVLWALRPAHLGGSPGFWTPVAELTPQLPAAIGWPTRRALGLRAVAAEAAAATGQIVNWRITDFPQYGAARVSKTRRNEVRRALRNLDYRLVTDPQPLLAHGWPVAKAAARRSGQALASTEAAFRAWLRERFDAGPQAVVGAFAEDRLVAFALSHGIAEIAYLTHVYIDPSARASEAGSGLYWALLCLWRRCPGVQVVSLGADLPHLVGLRSFKRSFGAEASPLPVVARMRLAVAAYLRLRRPETYARSGVVGGWSPA